MPPKTNPSEEELSKAKGFGKTTYGEDYKKRLAENRGAAMASKFMDFMGASPEESARRKEANFRTSMDAWKTQGPGDPQYRMKLQVDKMAHPQQVMERAANAKKTAMDSLASRAEDQGQYLNWLEKAYGNVQPDTRAKLGKELSALQVHNQASREVEDMATDEQLQWLQMLRDTREGLTGGTGTLKERVVRPPPGPVQRMVGAMPGFKAMGTYNQVQGDNELYQMSLQDPIRVEGTAPKNPLSNPDSPYEGIVRPVWESAMNKPY